MKQIKLHKIFPVLLMIFLLSCEKDALIEKPPHLLSGETLFVNYDGFQTALAGINAEVRKEVEWLKGYGNNALLFQSLYRCGTDVAVTNNSAYFGIVAEEWRETNQPNYLEYLDYFKWLYSMINAANTIITRAENSKIDWGGGNSNPEENKNRVVAEARALRAWCYRHLTYMWGDVPLTLTESGEYIKTDWVRTPVEEVRNQIISDLLFAETHLEINPTIRGTITKGAVQHLLSEMYLVKNKPDSALFYADKVITNPAYALITQRYGTKVNEPDRPVFMDMFLDGNTNREEGNTEALWVWQFEYLLAGNAGGGVTGSNLNYLNNPRYWRNKWDGVTALALSQSRGGRGIGYFICTKYAIIDNYDDPNDDRISNYAIRKWFILQTAEQLAPSDGGDMLPPGKNYGDTLYLNWNQDITYDNKEHLTDWPFSRKHEGCPATLLKGRNFRDHVVIRSAETYLLKAEAEFKLGRPQDAANTINYLRRRANTYEISAADIDIDFILDERARELLDEENRRYHLLRLGKWIERTKKYNHRGGQWITERDKLFPIPQEVIDANITMVMPQNPGY